ncbi:hypothetical protein [Paenibacillus sambharensis]|nr:hypothetical protein [Paenibacillus sambharensis]
MPSNIWVVAIGKRIHKEHLAREQAEQLAADLREGVRQVRVYQWVG